MRRSTILLSAIALFITFILLLTTLSTLGQIYSAIATLSPLLAQAAITLLILLLLAALIALSYYLWLFLRPRRKRSITLPESRSETAALGLQSSQQQIEQIEDEIARQALAAKSQGLARKLESRTFQIVVFGLGSAGKTALVNALLGEMAAPVAATLGTTGAAQTYRMVLESGEEILITDTPGLLEASEFGEGRAQAAKGLAATADLLLFVIDNDLHRVEYEPLVALASMGKRLLLVLNKCDRYLPEEKEQILQRIRERTQGLLNPADIVAVAAKPASVALIDEAQHQSQFQPDPNIASLVDRVIAVLRTEGSDLIANNLLLQSQRVSADAQALLTVQRQQQADAIVDRYQWIGAGVLAATPLPIVDMLATAAVNAQMVVELGRVYGVEVSIEDAKQLALSLAKTMAGLSVAKGAMKMLALGLQANVTTAVASKLVQGVSAAYLTRIAGKSFIAYFKSNQDWGDGGIQAAVERQYQLNRRDEFVKQFLRSAVDRLSN